MAKKQKSAKETDGVYFLKLVLYLIAGSFWVRVVTSDMQIPFPIGLVVGLLFVQVERFRIDRKIEYALLLVAMFIGFWLPIGIDIRL